MQRKKWAAQTNLTPEILQIREKRKWQIAFRRYVINKYPSSSYAAYFGLDIKTLRNWYELQFLPGIEWAEFGKTWHFEHIIPSAYFDFTNESELKLCWHFTNFRIALLNQTKNIEFSFNLLTAKLFLQKLYQETNYSIYLKLLEKIDSIEKSQTFDLTKQADFINKNKQYLNHIENFGALEFELLNSGRSFTEIAAEISFLKKFSS